VPDKLWSMGFTGDSLYQGKHLRTLNIIDVGERVALAY